MGGITINKQQLYKSILELRNQLLSEGIKYPLNIFNVCDNFSNVDISAVPFKTPGLRGMALLADSTSSVNCILVNANLSIEEQNFHGFHELIHIYESAECPGTTFNCYDKIMPNQDNYAEWIANEGAAELILPHDVLLPYIKEHVASFNTNILGVSYMVAQIATMYNVSAVVVQNRLNSLKYEIQQFLTGAEMSEIKILSNNQQNRMGISVDSLIDIETRRVRFAFTEHKPVLSTPFFEFSESYKGLSLT